ncbi:Gmad2 immunoglobulin-like domain-containing protein [Cellulomonas carbonis]|uniref:GerMN domain-containing protein n=1 Tax=Cellulomonas carbonis T26 TaxID=947969 RepID=A0A0A0BMY8_9CELL|nr:Gmad2 immunoglobulin-like domain-containing protein [Cellulomonas carbonis]KGM09316.1 hypothetical protein N868_02965 [Cellulomonas carbonis T26]GGC13312.1 hypothetical protein GCM10010972_28270 [Cellulomonas carbonis]
MDLTSRDEVRGARGLAGGPGRRAALAVAAVLLVAGCGGTTPTEPTAEPPTTSPGASPDESPTAEPTEPSEETTVPAYFMVDTRAGLRLAREHQVATGSDPVAAAVEAMIAGSVDPDYTTSWSPATEVLSVTTTDGSAVVDLSEEARTANVGSEGAALMVQQLVYTVTEAMDDPGATVDLLIEGAPAGELWGAVVWDGAQARTDPLGVRVLVQIDEPLEGATVSSPLTVSGDAAVFEANLTWRVLDASGAEVQSGFTMTAEGQTFAPYEFQVELEPGTWTVVVDEGDPSGGEAGGEPMTDSRTITVE